MSGAGCTDEQLKANPPHFLTLLKSEDIIEMEKSSMDKGKAKMADVGIIGMGEMGKMYAKYLSDGGQRR